MTLTSSFSKLTLAFCLILLLNACNKKDDTQLNPITALGKDDSNAQVLDMSTINADLVLEDRSDVVDYLITHTIELNANLTIKPGVTLMFADGAGLIVSKNGSLTAIGNATHKINFTSKSGKRGSWNGIAVLSTSAKNVFSFCKIEQGGRSGDYGAADLIIGSKDNTANAEVSNCEITASSAEGIFVAENSKLLSFANNNINTNTAYPLVVHVSDAAKLENTNLFSNNGKEYIKLTGSGDNVISNTITLKNLTESFLLAEKVVAGNAFTMNAGSRLYMDKNAAIVIDGFNGNGYFNAIGTSAQPISIISIYNQAGTWSCLQFRSSNSVNNQMEYCNISGGGVTGAGVAGMISILNDPGKTSSITVRNCNIMNSASTGIYIQGKGCTYNSDITTANTFANNAGGNIYID